MTVLDVQIENIQDLYTEEKHMNKFSLQYNM
jgi:hypothetical protein